MRGYNGIRIRMKTDGQRYKLMLEMDSEHDYAHCAYVNINGIKHL